MRIYMHAMALHAAHGNSTCLGPQCQLKRAAVKFKIKVICTTAGA
jgi:hypothetical protein